MSEQLPADFNDHYRVRAPKHEPVAACESALPTQTLEFDEVTDVVVVGSGAGERPCRGCQT